MDDIERAETNSREPITARDRRQYRGIAQHARARAWLLRRYIDASERAEAAIDDAVRQRWKTEADRRELELNRHGIEIGQKNA